MILDKNGLKGYQIGKTKVFLRADQMEELDARRSGVVGNAAKAIQRQIRTKIAHKEFISLRRAAIYLQSQWRGKIAFKQQLRREAAAMTIQKNWRQYIARKSYLKVQSSAITLQTHTRAMVAHNKFRIGEKTKFPIINQAHWHCPRDYLYYKNLLKAAIIARCGWRQKVARKGLRKIRMAARETRVLKEAKEKLARRVEELTLHLRLEKRLRTDLEKVKAQEITKLQDALHAKQIKPEEANSRVFKEQEVAQSSIEESPPVIQDAEKIDSLTAEVESLRALLLSERKTAEETKQAFVDALAKIGQLTEKLDNAERKVSQLQNSMWRPEETLSDIESVNQLLNQQPLYISPIGKDLASQQRTIIIQAASDQWEPQTEKETQKSLIEKQQDLLIKYISQDLRFSEGRPIAACVIYKCLLHWRSFFTVEQTSVFDRVIQTIDSTIEAKDDNDSLSRWLSNSSTLLLLFQRTVKASDTDNSNPQRLKSTSTSLFERISQGLQAPPRIARFSFISVRMLSGLNDLQVEAGYPALLFKEKLRASLEKIYKMIRDNLNNEIAPLLELCIQVTTCQEKKELSIQGPSTNRKRPRSQADVYTPQVVSFVHWESIVKVLNNHLRTLRDNYVPSFLINKVFNQVFSFINVQLFNSLLLQRLCCSSSDVEYVKAGLSYLENWCIEVTDEYAGSAWDMMRHIRQAVGFLVIRQKPKKTLNQVKKVLCPALNIQQLYKICTMYWDHKRATDRVSKDVMLRVRVLMIKDLDSAVSSPLLLEVDSSIPFSVEDMLKPMQQIDMFDIYPSPLSRENSG